MGEAGDINVPAVIRKEGDHAMAFCAPTDVRRADRGTLVSA